MELLASIHFPPKFSFWIKKCITTAHFTLSINGEHVGFFKGSRGIGIRQGDPLSPYLFALSMDVLNQILQKKIAKVDHFSFHWKCAKTKTTHLAFADDLLLFCKGDKPSIDTIAGSLNVFYNLTGLSPNKCKSEFYGGGLSNSMKNYIITVFGFNFGVLPVKYLGVPLVTGKLKKEEWLPLLEKMLKRVNHWTSLTLTYAGRLQLIKSVLSSIQNYWASHFILPSSIHKIIDRTLKRFLWKGKDTSAVGAKVNWDTVILPKREGSLGIRGSKDWNSALMGKHIWNIADVHSNSIWAKWARCYILKGQSIWSYKQKSLGSWTWKQLMKIRNLIIPNSKMKIGNGDDTHLWFSEWLDTGPLASSEDERIVQQAGLGKDPKVSAILSSQGWSLPRASSSILQRWLSAFPLDMPYDFNTLMPKIR